MDLGWRAAALAVACVVVASLWLYLFVLRKRALMRRMESGVEQVVLGVYGRLAPELVSRYGEQQGKMLAAAVANALFSRDPSTRDATEFRELNAQPIQDEIARLRDDSEIRHVVTQAVRVQAVVLHATGRPEQGVLLVQKLADLEILLPGGEAPQPMSFLALAREFLARADQEYLS